MCHYGNHQGYKFPAPWVQEACEDLRKDFEPQLEKLLFSRSVENDSVQKLQHKFCGDNSTTRACHNVELPSYKIKAGSTVSSEDYELKFADGAGEGGAQDEDAGQHEDLWT